MVYLFEKEYRSTSLFKIVITSLITSLVVGACIFAAVASYMSRYGPQGQSQSPVNEGSFPEFSGPLPQQISAEVISNISYVTQVAQSASPGVVGISVLRLDGNALFDTDAAEKWGVGTGVIVSEKGYILTNHHVAGGESRRMIVTLSDGSNVDGVCLWSDPVLDLAIVKIEKEGLTPIPIGNSDNLKVGEPAIAIGNPLGLQFQRTVTSGVISALNRTISIETEEGQNFMEDLIQTDASINPGNSGGPLLNARGEVIGINTVKVESAEAIGFAIPINVAVPIIKRFVEEGEFREPYIGIFAYDKETIPYLNNIHVDNGIYVVHVDKNGPAYKAGIREGCIIDMVDGRKIDTMIQLRTYIYSKKPGDTIVVTHLNRDTNKFEDVTVKLAEKTTDGTITR